MYDLTNSTKQSPSCESDGRLASQEMSCLVCKLNIRNRFYKIPLLVPIVSQMNPVNTLTPCSFSVPFNIILPYIT
jgi:hypothetical protein